MRRIGPASTVAPSPRRDHLRARPASAVAGFFSGPARGPCARPGLPVIGVRRAAGHPSAPASAGAGRCAGRSAAGRPARDPGLPCSPRWPPPPRAPPIKPPGPVDAGPGAGAGRRGSGRRGRSTRVRAPGPVDAGPGAGAGRRGSGRRDRRAAITGVDRPGEVHLLADLRPGKVPDHRGRGLHEARRCSMRIASSEVRHPRPRSSLRWCRASRATRTPFLLRPPRRASGHTTPVPRRQVRPGDTGFHPIRRYICARSAALSPIRPVLRLVDRTRQRSGFARHRARHGHAGPAARTGQR
jgi:hypothetical protein